MVKQRVIEVGRQAARAILIDGSGHLVLIKRTKPDQAPCWTAPGGGVEESDSSVEAALHRELAEELGATATGTARVFLLSAPSDRGLAIQHFFAAQLVAINESNRSGPEFGNPSRGGYDLERVDLSSDDLVKIDLRPAALKDVILANRDALLVETGVLRPAATTPSP